MVRTNIKCLPQLQENSNTQFRLGFKDAQAFRPHGYFLSYPSTILSPPLPPPSPPPPSLTLRPLPTPFFPFVLGEVHCPTRKATQPRTKANSFHATELLDTIPHRVTTWLNLCITSTSSLKKEIQHKQEDTKIS